MKTKKTRPSRWGGLHEHIVAIVIALVFVTGVAGVIFYRDTLFADITGGETSNEVATMPLVYEVVDGKLLVKTTKTFTDVASLSFYIMFDTKNIYLQLEQATSPYKQTYAGGAENLVRVSIFVDQIIPADTVVYELPINGSATALTITDASVVWNDGSMEGLAIQQKII